MIIRNEEEKDYRIVEEMIKKAFWNLSVPGCNEHYFAHQVRESEDYIPELDFVIEEDGKIIGHILYVKAKFIATDGTEKQILSFGPFTIHPDYQRKGYGRKLLNHSFEVERKWDTTRLLSLETLRTMPATDLGIVKDIMFVWKKMYIQWHF